MGLLIEFSGCFFFIEVVFVWLVNLVNFRLKLMVLKVLLICIFFIVKVEEKDGLINRKLLVNWLLVRLLFVL